jgi:hypothetical protein
MEEYLADAVEVHDHECDVGVDLGDRHEVEVVVLQRERERPSALPQGDTAIAHYGERTLT